MARIYVIIKPIIIFINENHIRVKKELHYANRSQLARPTALLLTWLNHLMRQKTMRRFWNMY